LTIFHFHAINIIGGENEKENPEKADFKKGNDCEF
jgi:hypothetical protein